MPQNHRPPAGAPEQPARPVGAVIGWGALHRSLGDAPVRAIAAGSSQGLALTTDGRVLATSP